MLKPSRSYDDKLISHKYYQHFYDLLKQYLPYVKRVFAKLYVPYTTIVRSNIDYSNLNVTTVEDILQNSLFNSQVDRSTEIKSGMVHAPYTLTGIVYTYIEDYPVFLIDSAIAANQLRISDSGVSYEANMTSILLVKFGSDNYTYGVFPGIKTFMDGVIEFYNDDNNPRRYKIVGESKYNAFGSILDTLYQCTTTLLTDEFSPSIYETVYIYNRNFDRILDSNTDQIANQAISYLNNVDIDFKHGLRLFGYKDRILNFDTYVVARLLELDPRVRNFGLYPYFGDSIYDLITSLYPGDYTILANNTRTLNYDIDNLVFNQYYVYQVKNNYKNYGGIYIAFVETILSPSQVQSVGLDSVLDTEQYVVINNNSSITIRYWLKFLRFLYVVQILSRA